MNQASDRISELNIVVANGVSADDGALRFIHLVQAATNDLLENRGVAFFRKAHNRERGNWPSAHGIDIAERIGGGYLAKGKRIVDDWREKIHGLNNRETVGE